MELTPDQKFSKDGPFNDPVVQCDRCQSLILRTTINKLGMCPECSNTRVRNVRVLTEEKMKQLKAWADEGLIDPDFLKLFSPLEDNETLPISSPSQFIHEAKGGQ